jgi:diguanylate cyclase (GGDEF)-like protein
MRPSVVGFLRGKRRVVELAAVPGLTAAGFWVLDKADLLAEEFSFPGMAMLLVVVLAVSEGTRAQRRDDVHLRVGVQTLGTAAIMYATGWGPVLAIGFMYPLAASVRTFGSRAVRPTVVFSLLGIAGGQLAIASDVAPSIIDGRLAHGLSVLGGLGLMFPSWVMYYAASRRERSEAQLHQQAFYDELTGLPNRALFLDRLAASLGRADQGASRLAVLFVDLDRFKLVNDSLGHDVGDHLLAGVAQRIEACVRPRDVVARLGGDEFTVLLEDVSGIESAAAVADRIREELELPFLLEGYEIVARASIGIALNDAGSAGAETLLRHADMAMYQAKRRGGSRYEVFDADMGARTLRRLELEARLRRAVDDREFALHFQPEVTLATGEVVGVEALVRWAEADGAMVSLEDVIPIAEETGLIVPLGRWVLEEACRQARAWFDVFPVRRPGVVSVNISTRQFQQPDLVDNVSAILGASGLEPARARLEITESAVMADADRGIAVVHDLKSLGVQIAIDDFGTGHSSLSSLSRFPVDVLKLDRSFVSRLASEEEVAAIVDAVVTMAHRLGMQVTAEGIETRAELHRVRSLGCDTGQGYLFCAPVPAEAVAEVFAAPAYRVGDLAERD